MINTIVETYNRRNLEFVSLDVSLLEELASDEAGHPLLDGPRLADSRQVTHGHGHGSQQGSVLLRRPQIWVSVVLLRRD